MWKQELKHNDAEISVRCDNKKCTKCSEVKSVFEFRLIYKKKQHKYYPNSYCLQCDKSYNQKRCQIRYKEKADSYRGYSKQNKERIDNYSKEYYNKNRDRLLEYRASRREQDNENLKAYSKRRRKEDPAYRLRQYVSNHIRNALFKNGSSKQGKSCLDFLNYTMNELKAHLESQFEPWMSWNNHGRYDSVTWDDNDTSTWTWQIDHIIPQSALPYNSMNHTNFDKCWSLQNLKPLSAKCNLIKGSKINLAA